MPGSQKKDWKYIAPFEVVIHNMPEDCWVSFHGKVLDITPLIKEHRHTPCVKPLIAHAGKDISHWFDEKTGDILHYIHPETGLRVPYCPHGRIPDVPVQVPTTNWKPLDRPPWWQDEKYQIGLLTKRVRPLRVVNLLDCKEVLINVCAEDTFRVIQERYRMFCSDIESYTWKYLDKNIYMDYTMEQNGIPDERDLFGSLGLPQNYYTPCVYLYFNDDMNVQMESSSEDEQPTFTVRQTYHMISDIRAAKAEVLAQSVNNNEKFNICTCLAEDAEHRKNLM